jgi:hypothetical protein
MTSPTSLDRLNIRSDTPLAQQIERHVTWLIASGRLQPAGIRADPALIVRVPRSAWRRAGAQQLLRLAQPPTG